MERPPLPPFTLESAVRKVRLAEDAWNSRDPERVALAYTEDSEWRNRSEFINGRAAIIDFLRRKWARELDYRLRKELWAFTANRIAVRFEYEFHDVTGQWHRAYGNENWEFAANGLMQVSLDHGLPVGFGVLTVDTLEQALDRAGAKAGNKGADAALAVIEQLNLVRQLESAA